MSSVELWLSHYLPTGSYRLYIGNTPYTLVRNTMHSGRYKHEHGNGSIPLVEHQTYAVRLVEVVTTAPPVLRIEALNGGAVREGDGVGFVVRSNRALRVGEVEDVRVGVTTEGDFGVRTHTARVSMGRFRGYLHLDTTDDDTDEANGTVTAAVRPWPGYGPKYTVAPAPKHAATVRVVDNDDGPADMAPKISIGAAASSITEGQDAVFTITADPAPLFDLPVRLELHESGDFGVVGRRVDLGRLGTLPVRVVNLTIPAGRTTVTHSVRTVDDVHVREPHGLVTASISCQRYTGGSGCEIDFANDTARVKVYDNDSEEIHASVAPGRVTVGDTVRFRLTVDPPLEQFGFVLPSVSIRLTKTGNFNAMYGDPTQGLEIPPGEVGLVDRLSYAPSDILVFTRPGSESTTDENGNKVYGRVTLTVLPSTADLVPYQVPRTSARFATKYIYYDDPPVAPLRPRLCVEPGLRLTLCWDEVPDATGYEVRWGEAGEPARRTARVSGPEFTTPELIPGVAHAFEVAACNDAECGERSPEVQGSVEPEATPPTANAGPDLEAAPGETVTLQGTGSVNPHGEWWELAHLWTQTAGPEVSLGDATKGDPSFTVPGDAAPGTAFAFALTVTDKDGEIDTDAMTVTVTAGTPPTASAGPDLEAAPGETVTLQGRGSINPHGKWWDLAHLWTQDAGPEVALSDVAKGDPRFTVPADAAPGTVFGFALTVTDRDGESDTDAMTVTVRAAQATPPTASAGPDLEAAPGETVTLRGTGSTNPHGAWWQLAHRWAQTEGPEVSLSDATKGDPTFTVPADAAPGTAFGFALTVTDKDAESDTDEMRVTVPASPPTANAGPDLEAMPGGTVALQGRGSTNPHGRWWQMEHRWSQVSGPAVTFVLGAERQRRFPGRDAATFGDPMVTVPADAAPGVAIELALTVTDKDGESDTDTMTVTVLAPVLPSVSVADARAEESSGWIGFVLTLDAPAPAGTHVYWTTASGTATGGLDYRVGEGTLRFEEGATTHTHWIELFDDAHDEGEETFTLTLSQPQGVTLGDAEATGTIVNDDPLLNAWLARFGRTVAGQTVDAVTERFAAPSGAGSHVTLGGQRIGLDGLRAAHDGVASSGPGQAPEPGARQVLTALAAADGQAVDRTGSGIIPGSVVGEESRSMTGRELLLGSSFHLSAGGDDGAGPRWTGWGRAALERFENSDGGLPVDGEVVTGVFGADWERGSWLAGVALSHSMGEGGMRPRGMAMEYDMESTLTAVHPYVRLKLSERVSAWGLVGYGRGGLTVTQKLDEDGATGEGAGTGRTTWKTDIAMTLGALGARGALLTPEEADGFGLALKGDAFLVRTTSDRIDGVEGLGNLAAADADASRVRLALEGSREMRLGEDPESGTLTPVLEIGARHDGGDAETGMGLEIGGGVRYADPASGLSMDLKARGLLAHEESGYREWGVSGSIGLAPGASGRGLSLSLTPAYGADAGSADRLWSARDAAALTADGNADPAARLEAEVGYGLPVYGERFTGTPYAGFGYSDTDRRYRLGWRLTRPADTGAFQFSLEASRRETAGDGAAPDHGIGFRFTSRW